VPHKPSFELAIHEAGHIVALHHFGDVVHSAVVEGMDGTCYVLGVANTASQNIVQRMAGHCAVGIHTGTNWFDTFFRRTWDYYDWIFNPKDYTRLRQGNRLCDEFLVASLIRESQQNQVKQLSPRAVKCLLRKHAKYAVSLLSHPTLQPIVERLAQALHKKRRLGIEEISALCGPLPYAIYCLMQKHLSTVRALDFFNKLGINEEATLKLRKIARSS
jgi:hypothetical protein